MTIGTKKQLKADSLLNSAFSLFNEKGFAQTSISDIVEKAGVAKGTFYLYFRDKTDLLDKLVAKRAVELFEKAYDAMLLEHIDSFEDQVICIVDYILEYLKKNRHLLQLISRNLVRGVYRNAVYYQDETPSDSVLAKMLASCCSRYRSPEQMIYLIIELVGSCCYNSILYGIPFEIDQLKPSLFTSIRAIMKSFEKPQALPSA